MPETAQQRIDQNLPDRDARCHPRGGRFQKEGDH